MTLTVGCSSVLTAIQHLYWRIMFPFTSAIFSSFHELMQSRGVCRPSVCLSVCPSVNFYEQVATSTTNMTRSTPNLHTMAPTWAYIQDVLKVKVKVKGHMIRTLVWLHENRFFCHKLDWIATKLTQHSHHTGLHPWCAFKVKVKVKGHVIRTPFWFDENRLNFYHKHHWIATKLAHDGPHMGLHPGCAQGRGRVQRSRDTGTSVMSRNVCYTVPSDVLSLHALTLWSTITSVQYKCQTARCNVYIMEWATPSLTVWLLAWSLQSSCRCCYRTANLEDVSYIDEKHLSSKMRDRDHKWLALLLDAKVGIMLHHIPMVKTIVFANIIRPPGTLVPGRPYVLLQMFFFSFATGSPSSLGRSPWNFATWSLARWIL